MHLSFSLNSDFVKHYEGRPLPFGFNGLGEVVFYRTYSKPKKDGTQESWTEVCERVINGMYSIQKDVITNNFGLWSDETAHRSAEEAFDRLWHLKWSPPGRGLAQMGTPFVHERRVPEALNNCAFVSTANIAKEGGKIFEWFMEMLMLGVGVGFDTRGQGAMIVQGTSQQEMAIDIVVEDSREGWANALSTLVDAYLYGKIFPVFDYSLIRPAGTPIKGFGGIASGKEPLEEMIEAVRETLESYRGKHIDSRFIVDIFNYIGKCVIAGNVRRSAEIALGSPEDEEFLNLKNYTLNPERANFGWASNNTIIVSPTRKDYTRFADRIIDNGEPGFFWLENAKSYARMNGVKDNRDAAVTGLNPCGEQILEHKEACVLVELYPTRHESLYDFLRSIKFAYLYGKTVTLTSEFIRDEESREVMERNRRIGLSMTGIAQFVAEKGIPSLIRYCEEGYEEVQRYDKVYSRWLGVNRSVRTTTTKPSGSVSLLAGVTPGIHYPESPYYIRRIRLADDSPLLQSFLESNYTVEKDLVSPNTFVVEFPVHIEGNIRSAKEVSLHEQLQLAAIMQRYWSDNSVSCTVTFDPKSVTTEELSTALQMYQSQLKAVSFLPFTEKGAYKQMPYEEITKEQYETIVSNLLPLDIKIGAVDVAEEKYCEGISCEIDFSLLNKKSEVAI